MVKVLRRFSNIPHLIKKIRFYCLSKFFPGSEDYWERRYALGKSSGVGSYNKYALFKAEILNNFVEMNNISTVIEYGCGDGNQLKLAKYPHYIGFDISSTAIDLCLKLFMRDETKTFMLMKEYNGETAQLTISLDVIYHLVEDDIFCSYMQRLFDSSEQFVIIYSSNTSADLTDNAPHIRHRTFTEWIELNRSNWEMIQFIPNPYPWVKDSKEGSFANFYIFQKSA